MKKKRLTINELLNIVPEDLLDELGAQTSVDHQVKKLTGKVVFKLFLYALSSQKDLSWRVLENIFSHYKFKQFAGLPNSSRADHSSLATRVSNIKVDYFAKIYEGLCEQLAAQFAPKKIGGYKIIRFDSTLVSIAGTLLKNVNGLTHGVNVKSRKPGDPVDIKFTIGFDGLTPVQAKFFSEQIYLSEDVALKEVIDNHTFNDKDLVVFDRGMNKRESFDNFTEDGLVFVTRLKMFNGKVRKEVLKDITKIRVNKPIETDTLWIDKDQEVYLYGRSGRTKHSFRLITARRKDNGKVIKFLTNEMKLSPEDVTLIYKYRWDIEVFFKFLKQEFGFKHLLSRQQNGIEVVLYMTLITFSLIYLYYKSNEVTSFKIAKMQFVNELDFEVMKTIVELCNGDPNLLHLLKPF